MMLKRLTYIMATCYAAGAGLSLFGVFVIIFLNSLQRYLLGSSFEWGEELPVYLAVYGIMFGLAWAYLQDRHIRFNIITNRLSKRVANYVELTNDLITSVLGVLIAYSGYLFMLKRGKVDASSILSSARALRDTTGIDSLALLGQMYPYYFAVCLGGGLLAISGLLRFANRLSISNSRGSQ